MKNQSLFQLLENHVSLVEVLPEEYKAVDESLAEYEPIDEPDDESFSENEPTDEPIDGPTDNVVKVKSSSKKTKN